MLNREVAKIYDRSCPQCPTRVLGWQIRDHEVFMQNGAPVEAFPNLWYRVVVTTKDVKISKTSDVTKIVSSTGEVNHIGQKYKDALYAARDAFKSHPCTRARGEETRPEATDPHPNSDL